MYIHVLLYTHEGDFIGYAIRKEGGKLQSTNIWTEAEVSALNEQLGRLNQDVSLKQFWPHPNDPEVLEILGREDFEPLEMEKANVVDESQSYYVWEQVKEVDRFGNATGRMVDGENYDEAASVIVTKEAMVPKRPSDVMLRIKHACEIVARERAGSA